jgi:hypothetical protein
MRTYTLHPTEQEAVESLVSAVARLEPDQLERRDIDPVLPTQIRRLTKGFRGAEWLRVVADYQDAPSEGYASLGDLLFHHRLPPDLDLRWEAA